MRAWLLSSALLAAPALGAADPSRSVAAFREALKVFRHPRCVNCHPSADYPTQGDDLHRHIMNIQRGPDDHGMVGQKCMACHTGANYDVAGVPGAPRWGLAPRSMGWQGKSDREICEQMKDKALNGGKSLADLVEHNGRDELVGWAWHPGGKREPAPGTQEEFGRVVKEWVDTGAVCP